MGKDNGTGKGSFTRTGLIPAPALTSIIALALVSFLLILPALIMGDALSGDAPVHVVWQSQFAPAVWHGTPYPRWLPDMNEGFGSPAFFFYPPMIQWLGALFYPLLPGSAHATTRLILALWVISAAGGAGCWHWLRALRLHNRAALLGSLLFLLMPYRCFVDVYQRGALAELAGICVMPWLLCFATRLKAGRAGAWGGYALSIAALLYSHLPAAVMGISFATAYVLALADWRDRRFVIHAATATVTGFMIGALGIATALGLLSFLTDTTAMWGTRNQPMNWLLFAARPWIDPSMLAMTIAMVLFAMAGGTALTAIALRSDDPQHRRTTIFLAGAIVAVILLNTEISRFFWELQTPLSRIQFPFRLLSIHAVALSGLAGLALHRLDNASGKSSALLPRLLGLAVPGLLMLDAGLLAVQYYRNRDDRPPDNQQMTATTMDTSEYVLGRLDQVRPLFGASRTHALSGTATSRALAWDSRHIVMDIDAATPARLALRQFAFTGWECRVDDGAWQRAASLPYPLNVPVCAVPAGQHRLEARLPATLPERAGAWLTLLGLLLVFGNIAIGWRAVRKPY